MMKTGDVAGSVGAPGRSAVAVVTEGDEGWPRPVYLAAACELLGLQASVEEQGGVIFRVHLPHSQRVLSQLRDTAGRIQESAESDEVGATGRHTDGSVAPGDDGEMQFAVGAMLDEQLVIVSFGKPVAWLGMSAEDARSLASMMCEQADAIETHERKGICACGDLAGTYSRHEANPGGHADTCPAFEGYLARPLAAPVNGGA